MSVTPSATIRIARCKVAGRTFGLDLSAILGIQLSEVVRREATDSDMVVDIIASKGRQLTDYSLAQLLGLPSSRTHTGHCIVATDGVDVWGLLVDRVNHRESRTASEVVPLPALKRLLPQQSAANVTGQKTASPMLKSADDATDRSQVTHRRLITFAPATASRESSTRFAFSVRQVAEITRIPNSVAPPGSPHFVVGLATWRNGPLPIVRLIPNDTGGVLPPDSSAHLAIVKVLECPLPRGLLVNSECELLSCPLSGTPVSAASIGQSEHQIRAAFHVGSQTLLFPRFAVSGGVA